MVKAPEDIIGDTTNQKAKERQDKYWPSSVLLGKRPPQKRADTVSGNEKGNGESANFG